MPGGRCSLFRRVAAPTGAVWTIGSLRATADRLGSNQAKRDLGAWRQLHVTVPYRCACSLFFEWLIESSLISHMLDPAAINLRRVCQARPFALSGGPCDGGQARRPAAAAQPFLRLGFFASRGGDGRLGCLLGAPQPLTTFAAGWRRGKGLAGTVLRKWLVSQLSEPSAVRWSRGVPQALAAHFVVKPSADLAGVLLGEPQRRAQNACASPAGLTPACRQDLAACPSFLSRRWWSPRARRRPCRRCWPVMTSPGRPPAPCWVPSQEPRGVADTVWGHQGVGGGQDLHHHDLGLAWCAAAECSYLTPQAHPDVERRLTQACSWPWPPRRASQRTHSRLMQLPGRPTAPPSSRQQAQGR